MADSNEDHLPTSSSTTKSPGGPIIQQSQESAEYQRALQTVVGTALGVVLLVGLLALFFLLYRLRRQRRRQRLAAGSQQHSPILQRSVSVDVGNKPVPAVLVLYAYDCGVHEAVVVALSGLLMEVCGVTVSLDVLEERVIVEQGLEDWLEDRLQEADFIVVVCSLGARLRCSKKRVRFRQEAGRLMPDYFAVAVDYVAEKLRVERSKGLGVGKFVTVVPDYSRLSDVPPQLEAAACFGLPGDLDALCGHLASPDLTKPPHVDPAQGEGEAGVELWAALGQARAFFKANPNWLEERVEPLPPVNPSRRRRSPKRRRPRESRDIPLLPLEEPREVQRDSNVNNNFPVSTLLHSRQNSLPSSLCGSQPPAPFPATHSLSRSADSFPPPRADDLNCDQDPACVVCGEGRRGVRCPLHPLVSAVSDSDSDPEVDSGTDARCGRSKSLPSVGPPSSPHHLPTSRTTGDGFSNAALAGSRTVLQAEVHQEWEAEHPPDFPRPSPHWQPASQSSKVWDLSQVPDHSPDWAGHRGEGLKGYDGVGRLGGRASPSSVCSDSSCSSLSGGYPSGSDSLERDLKSITTPRVFCSPAHGVPATPHALAGSLASWVPPGRTVMPPRLPPPPDTRVKFDFSQLFAETGLELVTLSSSSFPDGDGARDAPASHSC